MNQRKEARGAAQPIGWARRSTTCRSFGPSLAPAPRWDMTAPTGPASRSSAIVKHLERHQRLPRAPAGRARRGRQARCVCRGGGFPIEPCRPLSLAEPFVKPSTMLYRNFLAMGDRGALAQPSDRRRGCCSAAATRPTPGLNHGRDPAWGVPAILCAGRPPNAARQLARRDRSGSGSDAWKYWDEEARRQHHREATGTRSCRAVSRAPYGTCMVMGTARHHDWRSPRALGGSRLPVRVVRSRRRNARPHAGAHVRGPPAAASSTWCGRISQHRAASSPPRPSTTPSGSTWRWAARPNAIIHVIAIGAGARRPIALGHGALRSALVGADVSGARQYPPVRAKYLMEDFLLRRRPLPGALMAELARALGFSAASRLSGPDPG